MYSQRSVLGRRYVSLSHVEDTKGKPNIIAWEMKALVTPAYFLSKQEKKGRAI